MFAHLLGLGSCRERSDLGCPKLLGRRDDAFDERLGDGALDVHALDGGAVLPRVREGAPDDAVRGPLEVAIREDDRRILPTELE
jgi:hypothetical protein